MSKAIICDVCGKVIAGNFERVIIGDAYADGGIGVVHVIMPKDLDVCFDCWKKVRAVLVKEQEHGKDTMDNSDM